MRDPEPTTAIPLRWGSYHGRYVAGLILLLAGGALVQTANTYFLAALFIGGALHIAGWVILPARGWRRWVPALPSVIALYTVLGGPGQMFLLAIPFAGWLLVRHRPLLSWITLLLPIVSGLLLARLLHDYGNFGLALAVSALVLVASAWAARFLALSPGTARFRRNPGIPPA